MELVAKSYQNYEQVSEVFQENGKDYINVKIPCDRCGGHGSSDHPSWRSNYHGICFKCHGVGYEIKSVRVYTEKEYAALEKASIRRKELMEEKRVAEIDNVNNSYKESCGFKYGFITAVLGDTYPIKDELKDAGAKYSRVFKWYFQGNTGDQFIKDNNLETFIVKWEDVSSTNEKGYVRLMSEPGLELWFKALTYVPSSSEYQGEIGNKIQKTLKVKAIFDFNSRYGITHIHTMEDDKGNVYVWSTASTVLDKGEELNIQGTIKDHKEYNNVKQTVLTRCKVI